MNDSVDILRSGRVQFAVITVLFLLAAFLAVETLGALKSVGRPGAPATDTITVSGAGQATVAPDVARISFTVENSAKTVSEAQDASTKQTNAALDFLKGKKVEDADVRTLAYQISPQHSYPGPCASGVYCVQTPKVTGYQVSQTIEVKVHDLSAVGSLLEGIGKLEVQNVSGPSFALDDTTAGYDAARADAIAKAKVQAERLADELGVSLGKIVNFSESSGGYPVPMYAYGMGGAELQARDMKVSNPSIPTGENTYHASVSITYEIR